MSADSILTIFAMAVATYVTRLGGMLIGGYFPKTGRFKQAFDALPAAVLTALITPSVLAGPNEMIAGAVTAVAALRLPLLAALAIGIACVSMLRTFG